MTFVLRAFGAAQGESLVAPAELAPALGVTEADVARWIGALEVRGSSVSAAELAARAARQCLARAGLTAADVDGLLYVTARGDAEGRDELHVQALLGASRPFAVACGTTCSESVTALWMARDLLAGDRRLRRVLVVSGERYPTLRERSLGMSGKVLRQPVFSDMGAAALVERVEDGDGGGGPELLTFGAATDGKYWDYLAQVGQGGEGASAASTLQVYMDAVPVYRTALERCLLGTGLSPAQIDHVVLTREHPSTVEAIARHMGLSEKRVVTAERGPTHSGVADTFLLVEELVGRGAKGHALVASRTVGVMRCALVRLG